MKEQFSCQETKSLWGRRLLQSVPITLSLFVAIGSTAELMAANVVESAVSQQVAQFSGSVVDVKGQRNNLRGKSDKFISLPERKSAKIMETSGYRLLLPEGTLDYFIISDVKESSTEIVIYLEEKNEVPSEYSSMQVESKGFYEPVVVQDFPIRGKKLFLNIRRRRWIVKDEGRYVSRNWKPVAEGSRMTHDFASFLKELY